MWQVGHSLARDITAPPYRYLPWVVFVFAVLCFILHPNGAIRSGYLADTDDYMRLNETIAWLQGQGWFDLSHPRLSPGTHTVVHWARLLDIPLALIMLPLIKVMGMQNAALVASFIVPPATFALLLWLSAGLAEPFVGPDRSNLASLLTLFTPLTILNFVPGRVDHHGYEVLVAGFALLCLTRINGRQKWQRYAIGAALALACGLWIGTEALPWAVLFVVCLSFVAAWNGGECLRRAGIFGVWFVVSTIAVLLLAVAPDEYSNFALSWYSSADVVFAFLAASVLCGVWLVNKTINRRWVRFLALVFFGIMAVGLFCLIVPQVMQGPFADYDEFDATIALDGIGEAQPMLNQLLFNLHNALQAKVALLNGLQNLLPSLVSICVAGFLFYQSSAQRRLVLLPHAVFLATAIALTVFWQIRVGWFMQFFAVAPLTYLLVQLWSVIGQKFSGRAAFSLEILAFLALGFIPTVFVSALANDEPVTSAVVMFPAARAPQGCLLRTAADFLSQSWGYGSVKHTVLSSGNEGPELLFRTQHDVIAANFNVAGNEDAYNFFGATDDSKAQDIARKWRADLVLICRSFPLSYARLNHAHIGKTAFLTPANDGNLHLVSHPEHMTLVERLARGPVPAWLKPVEIPGDKDYLLFEVENKENTQ